VVQVHGIPPFWEVEGREKPLNPQPKTLNQLHARVVQREPSAL